VVRSRRVVTFLTEDEFAQLNDLAARGNLSMSAITHKLLTEAFNAS